MAAGYGLVNACKAVHQLAVEATGTLVEGRGELRQSLVERGAEVADRGVKAFFEEAGAQVQIHDRIVCRGLQALAEGAALVVK
ncbi:hypothetical protein D3C80_359640 [compost metagenome]